MNKYAHNQKDVSHGGKRAGAGRPTEGKSRFTVTLSKENVKQAKTKAENFSGLLDALLADWLKIQS
jgi:hypothetical protein